MSCNGEKYLYIIYLRVNFDLCESGYLEYEVFVRAAINKKELSVCIPFEK